MRPATFEVAFCHDGYVVRLRPSLRAALRLQRKYGIGKLSDGLKAASLEIIGDIVTEGSEDPNALSVLFKMVGAKGVQAIQDIRGELVEFVGVCFGMDDDPTSDHVLKVADGPNAPKTFSLDRALENLFELGTGWLGWSPADTWAATPSEIVIAHRGLIAKLKAIHGGADEPTPSNDPHGDITPEELRANIAQLRELQLQGKR